MEERSFLFDIDNTVVKKYHKDKKFRKSLFDTVGRKYGAFIRTYERSLYVERLKNKKIWNFALWKSKVCRRIDAFLKERRLPSRNDYGENEYAVGSDEAGGDDFGNDSDRDESAAGNDYQETLSLNKDQLAYIKAPNQRQLLQDRVNERSNAEMIWEAHGATVKAKENYDLQVTIMMIKVFVNIEQRGELIQEETEKEDPTVVDGLPELAPAVVSTVWQAAFDGNLQLLQHLLNNSVDEMLLLNELHQTEDVLHSTTPLAAAAAEGREDVVRFLVQNKKDRCGISTSLVLEFPKGHMVNGVTALMCACYGGHAAVAKILIEEGQVDKEKEKERDKDGATSLLWAACGGNIDVIEYLLQHGWNIKEKVTTTGDTVLHAAACDGHYRAVDVLISAGADVRWRNHKGQTPLHIAAEEGQEEVVQLLIKKKAEIGARSRDNTTALSAARKCKHTKIVEILLEAGAAELDQKCKFCTYL